LFLFSVAPHGARSHEQFECSLGEEFKGGTRFLAQRASPRRAAPVFDSPQLNPAMTVELRPAA